MDHNREGRKEEELLVPFYFDLVRKFRMPYLTAAHSLQDECVTHGG